jgi:hypothetical protein
LYTSFWLSSLSVALKKTSLASDPTKKVKLLWKIWILKMSPCFLYASLSSSSGPVSLSLSFPCSRGRIKLNCGHLPGYNHLAHTLLYIIITLYALNSHNPASPTSKETTSAATSIYKKCCKELHMHACACDFTIIRLPLDGISPPSPLPNPPSLGSWTIPHTPTRRQP